MHTIVFKKLKGNLNRKINYDFTIKDLKSNEIELIQRILNILLSDADSVWARKKATKNERKSIVPVGRQKRLVNLRIKENIPKREDDLSCFL